MIAKKIIRTGPSRFARLAKYMVAAKGGVSPETWRRTADYALDTGETTDHGEKVAGWRITNCPTDDPAEAVTAIEATQARNTTATGDKTYHLVYSFPEHERPHKEVLHDIEDELVKAIGLSEHQRISAVHVNTEHLHVHVAINKVHPESLCMVEPFRDIPRLMEACDRLEIKHGLERTNHGLTRRPERLRLPSRAADMQAYAGMEALAGYVAKEVLPGLHEAKAWSEVHNTLGRHGLVIKPRGAGLVIGSPEGPWVKASTVSRDLSMLALTRRLGPYEPPSAPPKGRYRPRPVHTHPATPRLYAEYQAQKATARALRNRGMAEIRRETALEINRTRQWASMQRTLAKGAKGPIRKALNANARNQTRSEYERIWLEAKAKRKALLKKTRQPTWMEWLASQASAGDMDALEVLRSRAKREERMRENLLAGTNGHARNTLLRALKPTARPDGSVAYLTADGGLVIDRTTHVQAKTPTAGAALVALELASRRFEGQALDVRGTDEFRQTVAKLAGTYKVGVTFKDPVLEAIRLSNLPKVRPPEQSLQPGTKIEKEPVKTKRRGIELD